MKTKDYQNITPSDFADSEKLQVVEIASSRHSNNSTFAIILSSKEEYSLLKEVAEKNNWAGVFGEASNKAGEHYSSFNSSFDLRSYHEEIKTYFAEKFTLRTKETEEESFLEEIKKCTSIEEVQEIIDDYNNIDDGYYDYEELVYSGKLSELFSYSYDVYTSKFAYKLPSKEMFYDGIIDEK